MHKRKYALNQDGREGLKMPAAYKTSGTNRAQTRDIVGEIEACMGSGENEMHLYRN